MPEDAPPTVLQVLPALGAGGAERSAVDVAVAAKRAGWTSLVASAGGRLVDEVTAAGVEHLTLPLDTKNPLRMGRNVGRLHEIIRTRRVDIVHARSRAPAWSAWTATRRAGRVFVTTFHGQYNAARAWNRAYNRVMARGDKVIAVSQFIVEHVKRTYGLEAERIEMIHRGLDPAVFDPAAVSEARVGRLGRDWDLPDDRPIVMLPGRLTRLKGQLVLIEAVARLGRDLHQIASNTNVAIMVVHHLRKAAAEDPFDQVSGSTGLTGAADTTLILTRKEGDGGCILFGRGRDLEEFEAGLEFDAMACRWKDLGDPVEAFASDTRQAIFEAIRAGKTAAKDIIAETGINADNIYQTLRRMVRTGDIKKGGRGTYSLTIDPLSEVSECQEQAPQSDNLTDLTPPLAPDGQNDTQDPEAWS